MELASIITPSDVVHLYVISTLVKRGIETHSQDPDMSECPFTILCLLGDVLDPPKCRQYDSMDDFMTTMHDLGGGMNEDCKSFLKSCVKGVESIESLEDLLAFFDNLTNLCWKNDQEKIDLNRLSSPTNIMPDSFLGIYVRACLSRWKCMDFSSICIAFDEFKAFQKNGATDAKSYSAFSINDQSSQIFDLDLGALSLSSQATQLVSEREGGRDTKGAVSVHLKVTNFLLGAHHALLSEDYKAAEDYIHSYFDYGDKNLISEARLAAGQALANTNDSIDLMPEKAYLTALDSLVSAANGSSSQTKARSRHQMAMVALVSMWVSGGHSSMALKGVDEGMKVSHHRGDHSAVTEALLLLHMIQEREDFAQEITQGCLNSQGVARNRRHANGRDSSTLKFSGAPGQSYETQSLSLCHIQSQYRKYHQSEEVLQRCLKRCEKYQLKHLGTQAAVLLIRLRLKTLAKRTELVLSSASGRYPGSGSSGTGGESTHPLDAEVVRDIDDSHCGVACRSLISTTHLLWKLASVVMYGDVPLLVRVAGAGQIDSSQLSDNPASSGAGFTSGGFGAGGANTGISRMGANDAVAEDANRLDSPLSYQETLQFLAQHTEVMVTLWRSVGLSEMARLQSIRMLRAITEEIQRFSFRGGPINSMQSSDKATTVTDYIFGANMYLELTAESIYLRNRGSLLKNASMSKITKADQQELQQCLQHIQSLEKSLLTGERVNINAQLNDRILSTKMFIISVYCILIAGNQNLRDLDSTVNDSTANAARHRMQGQGMRVAHRYARLVMSAVAYKTLLSLLDAPDVLSFHSSSSTKTDLNHSIFMKCCTGAALQADPDTRVSRAVLLLGDLHYLSTLKQHNMDSEVYKSGTKAGLGMIDMSDAYQDNCTLIQAVRSLPLLLASGIR